MCMRLFCCGDEESEHVERADDEDETDEADELFAVVLATSSALACISGASCCSPLGEFVIIIGSDLSFVGLLDCMISDENSWYLSFWNRFEFFFIESVFSTRVKKERPKKKHK